MVLEERQSQIESEIQQKQSELSDTQSALNEIQSRGGRGSSERARIRDLGEQIDRLKQESNIISDVQREPDIPEEQKQAIAERRVQFGSQVRTRQLVQSRAQELESSKLSQFKKQGFSKEQIEEYKRTGEPPRKASVTYEVLPPRKPVKEVRKSYGVGQSVTRERLEQIQQQTLIPEIQGGEVEFTTSQPKQYPSFIQSKILDRAYIPVPYLSRGLSSAYFKPLPNFNPVKSPALYFFKQGIERRGELPQVAYDVITFPAQSVAEIEKLVRYKDYRGSIGTPTQRGLYAVQVTAGLTIAGIGIGRFARGTKSYLTKEIVIKKTPSTLPTYSSKFIIKNIKTLTGKDYNLAKFSVTSVQESQKALVIKRYQFFSNPQLLKTSLRKDLQQLPITEVRKAVPDARLKYLQAKRVSVSTTENFFVVRGKVLGSVRSRGRLPPLVTTLRGTQRGIKIRNQSPRVSYLEGGVDLSSQTPIRNIRKEKLTKTQQKIYEDISGDVFKGLKTKIEYPRDVNLQVGGTATTDLFSVSGKGVKKIPIGKSVSRAEIGFVQKTDYSITGLKQKGLVEVEGISERISAVDVTYPRIIKPRKSIIIKSTGERREYDFTPNEPINSFKFEKTTPKQNTLQIYSNKATQKLISQSISSTAIKESKFVSKKTYPSVSSKTILSKGSFASAYAGLNLYERTESISARTIPSVKSSSISISTPKTFNFELVSSPQKEINRYQTRSVAKEITKEVTKEQTRIIPREVTKQQTRQTTRQVNRLLLRQVSKPPTRPPFFPRIPKQPRSSKMGIKIKIPSQKSKGIFGSFTIFGRRFGKFKPIGTATSSGQAIKIGTEFAGKTLGATFKVFGKGFKSPKNILGYKTKQSKKEGTIFIEEPRFRLSKRSEVKEINLYKSLRGTQKRSNGKKR